MAQPPTKKPNTLRNTSPLHVTSLLAGLPEEILKEIIYYVNFGRWHSDKPSTSWIAFRLVCKGWYTVAMSALQGTQNEAKYTAFYWHVVVVGICIGGKISKTTYTIRAPIPNATKLWLYEANSTPIDYKRLQKTLEYLPNLVEISLSVRENSFLAVAIPFARGVV